ncbi:MAG TPA: hypothetical protein VN903_34670 [Polyangia bacterium]|nr:hypothetical protein [Polyangia bacterium]
MAYGSIRGAALACTALAACGSDLNLPSDRSWQSAHFVYETRAADDGVCPDILNPLEEHFAVLQSYLGFAWPTDRKVTYYKFSDSDDFNANADCGPGAGGCAPGSTVRSSTGLDTHELVHAYLSATGRPPEILVEGVATVLACTADSYARTKPTQTWDQLASVRYSEGDPVTVYKTGAWLVGYLLGEFGPERFLMLYRTLPAWANAAAMDTAVSAIYGQPLSALWTAALNENQPRNNCVWQCSKPAVALDGQPFDTSAGACGAEMQRTFTTSSAQAISFLAKGSVFGIGPCGQSNPPRDAFNGGVSGGMQTLFYLPAGSYFLSYGPAPGTMTPTGDASRLLSSDCASATDAAALGAPVVSVAVPPSSPNWFLPLPPPPASGKPPLVESVLTATTASLCGSCDPTSCADASMAGAWTSGAVMNLPTDPTVPFSRFIFWF